MGKLQLTGQKNAGWIRLNGEQAESSCLGWEAKHFASEKRRVLKALNGYEIVEADSAQLYYLLNDIPRLSKDEERVLSDFIKTLREDEEIAADTAEIALKNFCKSRMIELDKEQFKYILEIVKLETNGFGPLTKLLHDDELEEIAVIGTGFEKPVYVYHRQFGWLKTNLVFENATTIKNLANKMARNLGRRLSMQQPKLNAMLPDGSRISACAEPLSLSGPCLTIRKFRRMPFTAAELMNNKTASAEAFAFLWLALQTDCNLLICGNTGSGKTTFLNSIFDFVQKNERILVTEETPEISLSQKHIVKLVAAEGLGIEMPELIAETLRMRPDRVIIGEIRKPAEVSAFIDTLLAGQGKGSCATFHAQSAKEAITRLKRFGVSELDISSLDLIVVIKRWTKISGNSRQELRRAIEIVEVGDEAKLQQLFGYNFKADRLEKKSLGKKVAQKVIDSFGLSENEFSAELEKRARFLKGLATEQTNQHEFFRAIEGYR